MKRDISLNTTCPDFSGNTDELKIGRAKIHYASSPISWDSQSDLNKHER